MKHHLSADDLGCIQAAQHAVDAFLLLNTHGDDNGLSHQSSTPPSTPFADLSHAATKILARIFDADFATRVLESVGTCGESILYCLALAQEHGLCTCCAEPRPMWRWNEREDWEHDDDETAAESVHVHTHRSSQDCDGKYLHERTYRMPDFDGTDTAHRLWNHVARFEVPLQISGDDTATIEIRPEEINWNRSTDEGGESGYIRLCQDSWCAHEGAEFRDFTAEAAGY